MKKTVIKLVFFLRYLFLNFFSRKKIVDASSNVVVTLTSHSGRVSRVFAAIESIGGGLLRPNRIILFLSDEHKAESLPDTLKRLLDRGLEIVFCEDVGPHTKYYPYLFLCDHFSKPLVTADDDKMYPNFWLKDLYEAWQNADHIIHCFRARKIDFEKDKLATYDKWKLCNDTAPSFRHFATGVSGVIYPPKFLVQLKKAGDGFKKCCPKADDIWLHVIALRNGYRIRQLDSTSRHFLGIPTSSRSALYHTNLGSKQNDVQASLTYNNQDINIIQRDSF